MDSRFLHEIESELDPLLRLKDNEAASFLVTNGPSTSERVLHDHIRDAFVIQFRHSTDCICNYYQVTTLLGLLLFIV